MIAHDTKVRKKGLLNKYKIYIKFTGSKRFRAYFYKKICNGILIL